MAKSEDMFACYRLEGGGCIVVQWVEGRGAAKLLQCPGQHATLKNYPAANIKGLESAMVAKSWIGKGGI